MVEALKRELQADYRKDLGTPTAPGFVAESPLTPVKCVGIGLPLQNARQRLKSVTVYKTAAATTYTQIATVTPTLNIYFLGVQLAGNQNDKVWLEDASTGNIAVSDASTSGLFYAQLEQVTGGTADRTLMLPAGRFCTSGIRIALAKSSTNETSAVVYFIEEDV